ncbi:MAG: 5'/3'-nucleotidase SurE [Alphaproteobacteria bacterium]|nr:5'/3'-nucleotidase SurE [Alphaproteobacteria bacterium]
MLDRVLLTNDDGIDAPGLRVLEEITAELAREIWVVAPEHDQSGVSHAVSLHHPLRLTARGPRRFGVTGTPGDCVVMGVSHLMAEAPPQLILSGVNRGANFGVETVFSGTVGGAMTGMMLGIPSIALSQAWSDRDRVPWDTARTLAPDVVRRLLAMGWGAATCLNVNFPDRAPEAAGPLMLARQGPGVIEGMDVQTRIDPRGFAYHWIAFRRGPREQGPESDIDAVAAGHIAVTPIRYDRTDEPAYEAMAAKLPVFRRPSGD